MKGKNYKIVSLYSFFPFQENLILDLKNKLLEIENENDLSGLLIFASEGINGTICAEKNVIDFVINLLNKYAGNRNLNIKVNFSKEKVFKKLKIKIKKEIVTMGVPEINPAENNGTYIDSADWNKLIKNQNTIVIDTRNHYEVSLGTFQNSINPNTRNFSEFPKWVSIQDQERKEYRKGIQCHFCIDQFSDDDRKRFEERQKQIDRLKVENHKIHKD